MPSLQQDLPDITLFRDGLSFGCLVEWRLAAYWIFSLPFRPASTMGKCGGRTDHPDVFVAIAFSSAESLNWDSQGVKEDGQFQNR
jgi:hypothetical protein